MKSSENTYETFNVIHNLFPYISMLYDDDVCIAITNRTHFTHIQFGKHFKLPYKVGERINPTIEQVIAEGKPKILDIPRNVMYMSTVLAAKCYFFPLFENDSLIGTLVIAVHLENKCRLTDIVNLLTETTHQMTVALQHISLGISELNRMNSDLLSKTNAATNKAKDTDKIVNIVQNISWRTNLLGLNAYIEASRSGESGRGFAVVANEIQKLSLSSKESIEQINSTIKEISKDVLSIDSGLEQINSVSKSQSHELQEISSTMNTINEIIEQLNELLNNL